MAPVVTEGAPEEWLNRVEDAMFGTTKRHLYRVLEESKGEGMDREVDDENGGIQG
jgi:dynein heavy chain